MSDHADHITHAKKAKVSTSCASAHMGLGGQCLNCGYRKKRPATRPTPRLLSQAERAERLRAMGYVIPFPQMHLRYRHKKRGTVYEVLVLAEDENTRGRIMVVYRGVDDNKVWVRPASQFFDGRFEAV